MELKGSPPKPLNTTFDNNSGWGTTTFPDGNQYVGEFKDGKNNGQGTFTWVVGAKYVGEYKDDKRNGQGTFTYPDGRVEQGTWENDKFIKPVTKIDQLNDTKTLRPRIKGLGPFKIGMTWNDFCKWRMSKNLFLEEDPEVSQVTRTRDPKTIVYTVSPNNTIFSRRVNYVPNHTWICVSIYSVADIKIKNINLIFKKDNLVKISADSTGELKEALTVKYGNPTEDVIKQKIKCTYTFTGASREKTDMIITNTWRDDTIKAYRTLYSIHDLNCYSQTSSQIDIYNKSEASNYSELNKSARKEYEKKQKNKKREELKKNLDEL